MFKENKKDAHSFKNGTKSISKYYSTGKHQRVNHYLIPVSDSESNIYQPRISYQKTRKYQERMRDSYFDRLEKHKKTLETSKYTIAGEYPTLENMNDVFEDIYQNMTSWDCNYVSNAFNGNTSLFPDLTATAMAVFNLILSQTLGRKVTRKIITVSQIQTGWGQKRKTKGMKYTGTDFSERTIRRCLHSLQRLGLITAYGAKNRLKSYRINIYTLLLMSGTHKVNKFSCFFKYAPIDEYLKELEEDETVASDISIARYKICKQAIDELDEHLKDVHGTSLEEEQKEHDLKDGATFSRTLQQKQALLELFKAMVLAHATENYKCFEPSLSLFYDDSVLENFKVLFSKECHTKGIIFCVQLIALAKLDNLHLIFSVMKSKGLFGSDCFAVVDGVLYPRHDLVSGMLYGGAWKVLFGDAYELPESPVVKLTSPRQRFAETQEGLYDGFSDNGDAYEDEDY